MLPLPTQRFLYQIDYVDKVSVIVELQLTQITLGPFFTKSKIVNLSYF